MLIGHYGVALAAKRYAPRTSLGTLNFAAEFADELWPLLLLLGVERVAVLPGLTAANPLVFLDYPISHSLLGAFIWGAAVGWAYYLAKRNRRGALVVGLVVLSHWVLDFPMHRADLPLWPGSSARVGLGAWRSVPLTIVLELAVFSAGLAVYLRATKARDAIGRWGLWAMVVVLVGIFASGFVSPPPSNAHAVAVGALGLWLFVPWGWWVDRHRTVIGSESLPLQPVAFDSPIQRIPADRHV